MATIARIIDVPDLPADARDNELVQQMVDGANAKAARVAPCLISEDPVPSESQIAEAKLILIGAVKRWVETSAGAFSQQQAGPFAVTVDTRQRGGFNLWPSEIRDLQGICKGDQDDKQAFSVDTVCDTTVHSQICAINFGASYCSCGADIAGAPIYELD